MKEQTVAYGEAAVAPEAPAVEGYNFTGWSEKFDFVKKDIVVKAKYSKIVAPAATGTLKIDVTGGTGFIISVNGGNPRPQGTDYINEKMTMGASVTVTAPEIEGVTFLGWMNRDGGIEFTTDTFTFTSTGNDYRKRYLRR